MWLPRQETTPAAFGLRTLLSVFAIRREMGWLGPGRHYCLAKGKIMAVPAVHSTRLFLPSCDHQALPCLRCRPIRRLFRDVWPDGCHVKHLPFQTMYIQARRVCHHRSRGIWDLLLARTQVYATKEPDPLDLGH